MLLSETPDTTDPPEALEYEIDAQDRIVSVSEGWLDFAEGNGAPNLDRSAVVGREIWDFLEGPTVRQMYEELFTAIRKDGKPRSIPFRCDAPDRRRFLQLTATPATGGGLRIQSEVRREVPRQRVALLDIEVPRTADSLRMCSWCKGVTVGGEVVEVEEAIRRLHLFDRRELPRISHGICERCYRSVTACL